MIVRFLTMPEVVALHDAAIEAYGGEAGLVAGEDLLDSAVSAPKARIVEGYLHADIYEMAAAYLYHIVLDHPFIDGNKRTGCAAAMTFLKANGVTPSISPTRLRDLAIEVQAKQMKKSDIAGLFRSKDVRRNPPGKPTRRRGVARVTWDRP